MDTSSFIMIGNKESGKTTSMISAYGRLSRYGINGFKIKAPNQVVKAELDSMFTDLRNGEYPLATQKRSIYSFDLMYNGSMVHKFEWKDFNGGIIDERPNDATRIMKEDMQKSSGLMLFFDAEKLYYNSVDAKVRRILHLISQNLRSIEKPFFISIIITKFDMLSDFQKTEEEKLLAPLMPFLNAINGSDYINAVLIPISCTARGMINVEIPILYMLQGTMTVYCSNKSQELTGEIASYEQCVKKSGMWDDITSFFNGMPTYRDIAEEKAQSLQPQIDFYNNVLNALNSLEEYLEGIDIMEGFRRNQKINKKYNF